MLDLNSLKNAFSNISEIGKGEETFLIGGTKITIRILLPKEETEVQKLSASAYSDEVRETGDENNIATTKYLETFKISVLSYSIIEVGDLSLRGMSFVPTGEKLPNGKEVKITKFKAMKDLLLTFSRPIVDNIFQRYNDLTTKTQVITDKSLDYEPINLEEEIKELEEKLEELKRKQNASEKFAEKKDSESDSEKVEQTPPPTQEEQTHDNLETQTEDPTPNTVQEFSETDRQVVQDPPTRQRVMPTNVKPPVEKKVQQGEMTKDQVMETLQSSFVDKEEDEPFPPSALMNEHERLNRLRNQRSSNRKPPHLRAKETAENVFSERVGEQVGVKDGLPVYRTGEVQEVGERKQSQSQSNISIDSQPNVSQNPRFRR